MESLKILFVDDNPVNLIAAENLMLSLGIQIDKAFDGETAIQMAIMNDYKIIFMDLLMPKLDGITTTKLLRMKLDMNHNTKIVATSGIEMNESDRECLNELFDDKIQKPLKLDQLKSCIEQWIGKDRLLQVQMLTEVFLTEGSTDEWKNFMQAMELVKDIRKEYFLGFDKKDVSYFMHLINASRKQLNLAIYTMNDTILSKDDKQAHDQLHALKSMLYYVGAHTLASMAAELDFKLIEEKDIQKRRQKFVEIMPNYQVLIERMTTLCDELEQAIHAYNSSIKNYSEYRNVTASSIEDISKQIEMILFHVARFEYIEILNGLNYLLLISVQGMKVYINQAITALEEFEYERVEELLKDYWNEISMI